MIEPYLAELGRRLELPARKRRRILDESRDHLLELTGRGRELGLPDAEAERRAIETFGEPRAIAREFHEQVASAGVQRLSGLTAALLVAFLALQAIVTLAPAGSHADWASSGGYGVLAFFLGQVAAVAGVLGIARSLRYRPEGRVPLHGLGDIVRADAVALGCTWLVTLSLGAGLVVHSGSIGDSGWGVALAAGVGATAALALATSFALVRSLAAARPLPEAAPQSDALDDLQAVARLVPAERVHIAAGRGWQRLRDQAPGAASWLDLRGHPWRFCMLFAAACGLAVALAHALSEGGPPPAAVLWKAALAALLIASIEGAAVVVSFLALGRFLGIRR